MNSKKNLKPFIDIIVPNYNKGPFIRKCIKSIVHQSYKNWFLYIIDDASNDESTKFLKDFSGLTNINIIFLKKNKGPHFCRNLGLRKSKSDYISFLDSDDYWETSKLEEQINFMKKNDYDFTYSDYISFFEDSKSKLIPTNIRDNFDYNSFVLNSSINSSTMIIKRNIINFTKFKKIEHEDYLFKCEILKKNVIAYKYNKQLAYYRILKSSRSTNKVKSIFSLWKINKKFNKMSFFENIKSIFFISLNSLKKYGLK